MVKSQTSLAGFGSQIRKTVGSFPINVLIDETVYFIEKCHVVNDNYTNLMI